MRMLLCKRRKRTKDIVIDKQKQSNADQLLQMFETIENVEIVICEKTGIIHVKMPQQSAKERMKKYMNAMYKDVISRNESISSLRGIDATTRHISGIMVK